MTFCSISFDNPQKIYYSGQTVSGTVELPFEKRRMIQYLSVKIEGYASCNFRVQKGNNKPNGFYSGKEIYFTSKIYLIGTLEGQPIELPEGIHSYRFACTLPKNVPTSFESSSGKIRYCCTITLERPWTVKSIKKESFTVIKQIDLNNESPAIRLPNKQEVTKMYSSIFSKNGEIYMSLQIPAVGFVAGQKMCIVIDVSNNSNITVDEIKLSLKKTVCYNATLPGKFTKEKMEPVEVKRLGGVGKHDKTTFDVPFEIPAIPPTNQGLCKVISIHYEIEVKAKVVNTFHNSAKISIPILIGTIPINPAIAWQHQSNLETTLGPFASTSTFISELPPPTYQEVLGMGKSHDNEDNDGLFVPRYPVYHFQDSGQLKNEQFGTQNEQAKKN